MNENIYISTGNLKMKGVLIFSLPAMVTCPNKTKMCEGKCYAKKAERLYPPTLPARQRNLEESRKDTFVDDMVEKIKFMNSKRKKYKFFRIHEGGDFYSTEYYRKWMQIILRCPEITFLAFTKSVFIRNYLDLLPSNLNLFYSVWNDTNKDNIIWELPLALAGNCDNLYKKEIFQCKGNCNECYHCFTKKKDVGFKIH